MNSFEQKHRLGRLAVDDVRMHRPDDLQLAESIKTAREALRDNQSLRYQAADILAILKELQELRHRDRTSQ